MNGGCKMCWNEIRNSVPVFIMEDLVELIGTLIASVFIAVITTYVFNRIQERQKVKARVMHFRLEMYEQIIECLKRYDRQISLENDAEQIKDVLTLAEFTENEYRLYTSYVLYDWQQLNIFLEELDQLCVRGIYILDDAVFRKLLSLKIYVFNCVLFTSMLDGYQLKSKKEFSENEKNGIKELFYQYYSLTASKSYEKFVADLEQEIHRKRVHLKFEQRPKNYKVAWRQEKLRKKVWKKAGYKKQFPKAFVLLGLCACEYLRYDSEQTLQEIQHWTKALEMYIK